MSSAEPQQTVRVRVWDIPTRVFHWSLAVLLVVSWQTYELDMFQLHKLSGYAVLTLVLFRIAWGILGSDSARFSRFIQGPGAGLRHLRGFGRAEPDEELGHNAAGGWMVLFLLLIILVQAATGLFSDDGILDRGPLARAVDPAVSDWATRIHAWTFNVILAAAALHIVAVLAYALLKGHDLITPMITGAKRVPARLAAAAPRMASPLLALVVLAAAAGAVYGITWLG
jgi:cytochrome b